MYPKIFAIGVFLISYALIVSEKISSAIIVSLGAFVLVFFRILTQQQAVNFIDFNTIGLLIGMMITVAVLRKSGAFEYLSIKAAKSTGGDPWKILLILSLITALFSAFLDNVTTVLIIVPITFAIADSLKINPIPLLIAEILFSNIGGTATLIGDPPNILIGGATGLGFMDFIYNNTPIIIIVGIFNLMYLKFIYRKDLIKPAGAQDVLNSFDETKAITDKKYLVKTAAIFFLIIIGFMTHNIHKIDLASLALGGGFLLLLVSGMNPEEVLNEVEWPTLFFFSGLFILVGALEHTHVILLLSKKIISLTGGVLSTTVTFILWFSAIASSFLDNVPYTATMISLVKSISRSVTFDIKPLWWALSLGACLGGNGSPVGAAANIIVIGFSKKSKTPIKFGEFLKVSYPLMLLSIAIVNVYIYIRYL